MIWDDLKSPFFPVIYPNFDKHEAKRSGHEAYVLSSISCSLVGTTTAASGDKSAVLQVLTVENKSQGVLTAASRINHK
jgi:hypothetical protein